MRRKMVNLESISQSSSIHNTVAMQFDEKTPPCYEEAESDDLWAEYASGGNPFLYNGEGISRRMKAESRRMFSSEEKMQVEFLDVVGNSNDFEKRPIRCSSIKSLTELDNYLTNNERPDTRIISISAPNSIKPLKITDQAMQTILTHHNVGPQFLDLLLSFATGSKESEAGPGSMTVKNSPDGSYELQYRLSYVEEVVGTTNSSWAIRQTGVYHRHVPKGPGSVWIFLHPRLNSPIQRRLEQNALNANGGGRLREDWEFAHVLALSSYFGDWRWYLKSLSADIERIASIALSLDFEKEEHYIRGTETLQDLHSLLDRVLPLAPRLNSTLATVNSLKSLYETLRRKALYDEGHSIKMLDELRYYVIQTEGHLASVSLLEKRVQEILSLLAVALNLKSQSTAVNINRNIWSLTKDTVDDSATVKLVTIVTLLYLPASFVATFLGMNLFSFQSSDGSGFQISEQFWLYVVITIPLTFLTVGSWAVLARRRRKQKELDKEREALNGGSLEEV